MREPDRLYEEDFYTWTQLQAAALRRLKLTQVSNEIDLVHVVEEIADLGNAERNTVMSLIGQLFAHLMKVATEPDSIDRKHWLDEIEAFRSQAYDHFSPGMRRHIDMETQWTRARKRTGRSHPLANIVDLCPFTLDQVLDEDFVLEDVPILKD